MKRGPSGLNVAKAIPGFLQYKAAEGISQATLVGYEHDLNVWLKYMGDKAVDQVSVQDIRIRDWMAIAINPDFACALLEKTTQIAIGMVDVGLKACGKYIQILRLAGDDMGHQSGTLLSPITFRKIIKPYFSRLYTFVKSSLLEYDLDVKMMAHTDGDVYRLIPDYIEMGLDILNPVQPGVTHMDHEVLKKEFGDKLSFHAGIDIQHLLPHGSPDEVKEGAKQTIRTLGKGGGYIVAPTHYLLPDIPPENVFALRDTVIEFGNYPLE